MPYEKDRRAGRTYVEPGELSARERNREYARRRPAAPAPELPALPLATADAVREEDAPLPH